MVTGSVFGHMLIDTHDVGRYSQSFVASLLVLDSQLIVGAAAGGSFLCSLGITMLLLHAQQRQKRAKDWHQWEKYMPCSSLRSVDRDWAPLYSCWHILVL